jgi:hypothetical protein
LSCLLQMTIFVSSLGCNDKVKKIQIPKSGVTRFCVSACYSISHCSYVLDVSKQRKLGANISFSTVRKDRLDKCCESSVTDSGRGFRSSMGKFGAHLFRGSTLRCFCLSALRLSGPTRPTLRRARCVGFRILKASTRHGSCCLTSCQKKISRSARAPQCRLWPGVRKTTDGHALTSAG